MFTNYIELDLSNFPNMYEIDMGNRTYFYRLNYADETKLFTLDIYDMQEEPIVFGEPLVLDKPLWADIINPKLPSVDITPISTNGDEISLETLNRTVFLRYGGA